MRQFNRTGRTNRTAAWLLVIGILCTVLPASASAESRSAPASVDFTSEPAPKPVSPVDPDRPGSGGDPFPDIMERETVTFDHGEDIPTGRLAPLPERPGAAGAADDPGATGASGWLSINYVTPLNFGTQVEDGTFAVQQKRPYLQTSDLRGNATGWKVTAIAGPFQDPGNMSPILALVSFSNGSSNSAHTYLVPPEIPDLIELPANGRTQRLVAFAHENQGVGIWVVRWYPKRGAAQDFQLRLFSPASGGSLGCILWVMNDAP